MKHGFFDFRSLPKVALTTSYYELFLVDYWEICGFLIYASYLG